MCTAYFNRISDKDNITSINWIKGHNYLTATASLSLIFQAFDKTITKRKIVSVIAVKMKVKSVIDD